MCFTCVYTTVYSVHTIKKLNLFDLIFLFYDNVRNEETFGTSKRLRNDKLHQLLVNKPN